MVGPLKKYKRDPMSKGRGSGLYYYRGKGYYSKYSVAKDMAYHAKPKVVKHGNKEKTYNIDWRRRKVGHGSYRHTRD